MKLFTLLSFLCLSIMSATADDAKPVTHVDADAAAKLVKEKKVQVLDVRTEDEFKDGHIEGAKLADFTDNSFEETVKKLDRDQPYLVHCAAGGRSAKSLPILQKLGFKKLYHLDGGFKEWKEKGHPVK